MSLFKYFDLESGNKESEGRINRSIKRSHSQGNQGKQAQTSIGKNQEYENKKRKRLFVQAWTKEFTWLDYNRDKNIMSCRLCADFPDCADKFNPFYLATSTFRKSSVKTHAKSKTHAKCQSAKRAKEAPKITPMTKIVAKMNEEKF